MNAQNEDLKCSKCGRPITLDEVPHSTLCRTCNVLQELGYNSVNEVPRTISLSKVEQFAKGGVRNFNPNFPFPSTYSPFRVLSSKCARIAATWLLEEFEPDFCKKNDLKQLSVDELVERLPSNITSFDIQGYFIPYWEISCEADVFFTGISEHSYLVPQDGYQVVNRRHIIQMRTKEETEYYANHGEISQKFHHITVCGGEPNDCWVGDRVFSSNLYNELQFSRQLYVPGVTDPYKVVDPIRGHKSSETYNRMIHDLKIKIRDELKSQIYRQIPGKHKQLSSVDIDLDKLTGCQVLLPVWEVRLVIDDKPHTLHVNGLTGELNSNSYSPAKQRKDAFEGCIILTLVLLLVFAILFFKFFLI